MNKDKEQEYLEEFKKWWKDHPMDSQNSLSRANALAGYLTARKAAEVEIDEIRAMRDRESGDREDAEELYKKTLRDLFDRDQRVKELEELIIHAINVADIFMNKTNSSSVWDMCCMFKEKAIEILNAEKGE